MPLYFVLIKGVFLTFMTWPTYYGHPNTTNAFYHPYSVSINGVWLVSQTRATDYLKVYFTTRLTKGQRVLEKGTTVTSKACVKRACPTVSLTEKKLSQEHFWWTLKLWNHQKIKFIYHFMSVQMLKLLEACP